MQNFEHLCLPDKSSNILFGKETKHLTPSLIRLTTMTGVNSLSRVRKSFLLAAIGVALAASALLNLFSGLISSRDV